MMEYCTDEPLIFESAEGALLYATDGRAYLDGISSLWANLHGHRVPALDQALTEQIGRVAHTTLLGHANIPSIRLAEKLTGLAPAGLTKVFYSDDGATAVEVALKIAFQYWRQAKPEVQRTRFLALENAYHGDTLGAVSVGGIPLFHGIYGPLLFDVHRVPAPHCYRCPLGEDPDRCLMECVDALAQCLDEHGEEIAAMIVEPLVQGAGGMIVWPEGYLRAARELTREHGILLIADEVAVGFGRTGTLFACEQEGVTPDMLVLGKGITGGYLPLAATLVTQEIYDAFLGEPWEDRIFYHGHTYTGNQLGASVALASLEVFETEGTMGRIEALSAQLARGLERFKALPHVGDVRQKGLMVGIELVADCATKAPFPRERRAGHRVCRAARDRGLVIRPLGDVIVLMPPYCITDEQLERLLGVTYDCIAETTTTAARKD